MPVPATTITAGAVLLHSFAAGVAEELLAHIDGIAAVAPFRHMVTPGGKPMSVAMTNCGAWGWVTDRKGYRYESRDPASGEPWPAMPAEFARLSQRAAEAAGFPRFVADACLVNQYEPGAKMTLHQDRDEVDFSAPIVSVSLGLPATFQFGGLARSDKPTKVPLEHGDVIVWGGPARLHFHGIMPLKDGEHPLVGRRRINLTFRKAK